ncbi:MAG: tyrosine-type recombinase/integrase [Actinomycetota bacterium]
MTDLSEFRRGPADESGTFLDAAGMLRLIGAQGGSSSVAIRNRAIVGLLCATGLRLGEVLALAEGDVNLAHGVIEMPSASQTREVLIIEPAALDALRHWMRERRELDLPPGGPLFVTIRGGRLSDVYVRQLITRLAERAGLPGPLGPEVLRRSVVAELVRQGWGLPALQVQLGHPSRASTMRYLRSIGLTLPDKGEQPLVEIPEGTAAGDMAALLACRYCRHGGSHSPLDDADVLSSASDAVLIVSGSWEVVYANPAAEMLLSRPRSSFLNRDVWAAFPELAGTAIGRRMTACMRDREAGMVAGTSPVSNDYRVARILPTADGGLMLWVRGPSALMALMRSAEALLRVGLRGSPGRMALLRVARGADGEVVDVVVSLLLLSDAAGEVTTDAELSGANVRGIVDAHGLRRWFSACEEAFARSPAPIEVPLPSLRPERSEDLKQLVALDEAHIAAICPLPAPDPGDGRGRHAQGVRAAR